MADLLYTVFTNIDPKVEKEFQAWQESEHIPYLLSLPGYQSVSRYRDLDTVHRYTNFWHISSISDFKNPERLILAQTPWGNYLSPYRDRRIDFYVQDEGLDAEPPEAELDEHMSLLVMDCYRSEDDLRYGITARLRALLDKLRAVEGILDARIYHAYQNREIAEDFIAYYIARQSADAADMRALREVDGFLSDEQLPLHRTRLLCLSQNSAKERQPIPLLEMTHGNKEVPL